MSTWDKLQAMGLKPGDVVRAPDGLARLRRPYFAYAMVRYVDGRTVGYAPSLLRKATEAERATFEPKEAPMPGANDPMTAWVLQVYLRDFGLYLWTGPSAHIYGGFAAYAARRGALVLTQTHHANTVQEAATAAAAEVMALVGRDLSEFPAWRERWEARACADEGEEDA